MCMVTFYATCHLTCPLCLSGSSHSLQEHISLQFVLSLYSTDESESDTRSESESDTQSESESDIGVLAREQKLD